MRSLNLGMLLAIAFDITVVAHKCQNARPKTVCEKAVTHAMLHGFAKNPKKYIGLSIKSTFTDFQAYFHNNLMHECPRPCLEQEEPCKKFGPGYPGMGAVNWAKQIGIPKNPQWYPDLPYPASDKQIAKELYRHGDNNCPRPCDDDEEEGHFVPMATAPVLADSEGWLTSTTVTVTSTTVTSATATTATATTVTIPPPTMETTPLPPTAPATTKLPLATTQPATTQTSVAENVGPPVTVFGATKTTTVATKTTGTTVATKTTTVATDASVTPQATKTTTVVVTEPVTTAPATTSKAPVHEESCFKSGKSLSLLDAVGYTAVSADSSQDCQTHCKSANNADIGFFLWYEPLKTCHCPPSAATEIGVGPEFVSGPLSCDIALSVLADSSIEIFRSPSVGFRVPAILVGTFLAVAVVGAAAVALRRRPQNNAAHLDDESGGLEFLRTWPDTGSAVE